MSNHGVFNQLANLNSQLNTQNTIHTTGNEHHVTNHGKLDTLNTQFQSFSGHSNNTTAIGDGSTQLRTVPLGYNQSAGQVRSLLCDAQGHQQIDIVSGGDIKTTLDGLSGAGNNNVGEGQTKLQIYNYGRDVSAGNYKPMVVNSSAEQIVALSAVDNAVLDTIATNTANINVNVGDVEVNTNDLEVLQTTTNSLLTTMDAVLDTIKTDSAAIKTAVELIDNTVSGSELQVDIVSSALPSGGATESTLSAAEVHLGNIETAVQLIDNAISGSEMQVDIVSSALPSGAATESTLSAAEVHLGNIETAVQLIDNAISGSEMQVDIVSSALPSGASTEATLSAAEVHVGNIETNQTNGNQQVKIKGVYNSSLPTVSDGGFEFLQADVNGRLEVRTHSDDVGVATVVNTADSTAIPITGVLVHDDDNNAVRSLKCDTNGNLLVSASLSATDNAVLDTIDSVLDTIKVDTEAIETAVEAIQVDAAALEVLQTATNTKLDTLETTLTAIETDQAALEVLHTATNSKLDTIDGVLDNILIDTSASKVDLAALEVLQTATNTKLDTLETTLTAIETDQAALEVLHTATNSKIDTLDAVVDAAEVHLGNIETAVQLIDDVVKAEDTAHGSGDKGIMSLVVRQDSHSDLGADGDYVPMTVNANGELRVTTGSGGMTLTTVDTSLTLGAGATDTSAAVEITNNSGPVSILVQSNVLGSTIGVSATVSMDGSTFHALSGLFLIQDNSGNSVQLFMAPTTFRPKFIKLVITNNDTSSRNYDSFIYQ